MSKLYLKVGNVEAERSVLGAMLMDPGAASYGLGALTVDAFSDLDARNKLVFQAMVDLADQGKPIDPQMVTDRLINAKTYEDAGGAEYLQELLNSLINPDNVEHYVRVIRDQALLRDYLKEMDDIERDFQEGSYEDIGTFISTSTDRLDRISSKRQVGQFLDAATVAEIVRNQIDQESKYANRYLTGIDTGFKRLNKIIHGWQKNSLVILAARPSVGKTALAINFAYNAATYSRGGPVAFFSCEMDNASIMKRLLSAVSNVEADHLQTGDLDDRDREKINSGIELIKKTDLYFDDTPNALVGDIIAKAKKLKTAHPDLCLIVIDYLNILGTSEKFESKNIEIGAITKSLKGLARDLQIPVICLAQINRKADDNTDGRPTMSNLKDSGNIEQDADLVLILSRSDYGRKKRDPQAGSYVDNLNQQLEANRKAGKDKASMSISNIEIAKNRNGPLGNVTLVFSKSYSRFDNPSLEMERQIAEASGNPLLEDDE